MAETTNGVVNTIADVLLKRVSLLCRVLHGCTVSLPQFDGAAGEKLCHACAISASNQVSTQ